MNHVLLTKWTRKIVRVKLPILVVRLRVTRSLLVVAVLALAVVHYCCGESSVEFYREKTYSVEIYNVEVEYTYNGPLRRRKSLLYP